MESLFEESLFRDEKFIKSLGKFLNENKSTGRKLTESDLDIFQEKAKNEKKFKQDNKVSSFRKQEEFGPKKFIKP